MIETEHVIRYLFTVEGQGEHAFTVRLDPTTLVNVSPAPPTPPEWTRLSFHRCPNCPLEPETSPCCPAALRAVDVVDAFSKTMSFQKAHVRVQLPEREVVKDTEVQTGLSSLLGVLMATSGCPVLATLRPMVRFHLPFATEFETLFRSVSTYLVGQFLRRESGAEPDWSLRRLAESYRAVGEVNRTFAKRLWSTIDKDAHVNALVLLDVFAKALPSSIEERLEELRPLFTSWPL